MAWNMTAQIIESCSCNMLCPCWFGVPELAVNDQGWCASAIAFRVQQGTADGVDLSGRTVVWAPYFPENMFNGNGTARLYVDAVANADQRRELEAIFTGKKGGPMAALGGLISTWLATKATKMEIQEEGDTLTVTVDGFGQVKSQRMKNPAGQPVTLHNAGMAAALQMETVELAPSGSRWSDPDLPRPFETKSGAVGTFTWSA